MFFQILRAFRVFRNGIDPEAPMLGWPLSQTEPGYPRRAWPASFYETQFRSGIRIPSGQRREDGMRPIRSLSVNAYDSPVLGSVEASVLPRSPASGRPRTPLLLGRTCSAAQTRGPHSPLRN
jgi:hypothetical protein